MTYELISLIQFPTMPAPFSSAEPGEAWVWDDFVLLLQVRPLKVADTIAAVSGHLAEPIPMQYPFALSVFYRKDRNPHGPSSRPIVVATIEKADYAAALKMLGKDAQALGLDLLDMEKMPALVLGMFDAEAHINWGDFEEVLTVDTARKALFDITAGYLDLEGAPVKIGVIHDIHGHPATGWPPEAKKSGTGCLVLLTAAGSLGLVLGFLLSFPQ